MMSPRADNFNNNAEYADESKPLLSSSNSSQSGDETQTISTSDKTRILIGFWILGLCNNFGYVVMLSAAYDILKPSGGNHTGGAPINATLASSKHHLICNQEGTGVILLADIIPTLLVKTMAPFFMHRMSYNIRVIFCLIFSLASFTLVGVGADQMEWLSIIGVVCASLSFGFGEIVFLSFSSHFNRHTVTTWASGTGAAGLFGSLIYSGLRQLNLSAENTLFTMMAVPVLQALSFYLLIVKPPSVQGWHICESPPDIYQSINSAEDCRPRNSLTLRERVSLIVPLLKYMIPLTLIYLSQYFINQALVGVFISRSSGSCCVLKHLWILPILQFINLSILFTQVLYHYMPENYGIWIVFSIILWEGLLGGTGYVQTFTRISKEVPDEHKEHSMAIASASPPFGIVTSALLAIVAHNALCNANITW